MSIADILNPQHQEEPELPVAATSYFPNTFSTFVGFPTLGCLLWISLATRPDISFAVAKLAIYSSNPSARHLFALTHLRCYLFRIRLSAACVFSAHVVRKAMDSWHAARAISV